MNVRTPEPAPNLRVQRHDRSQIELKIGHPTDDPAAESVEDTIELWFFLPLSSGVTAANYAPQQFYADLRSHTRLRTPSLTLAELCRTDRPTSPLGTLSALHAAPGEINGERLREIRRESRLLGCMIKSALRDAHLDLEVLPEVDRPERIAREVGGCAVLLERWRELAGRIGALGLDEETRQALRFSDESLSLQVEVFLLTLLHEHGGALDDEAREAILAQARAEQSLRAGRGDRSVLRSTSKGDGESFLDQANLLKKYIASVLWLEDHPHRGTERLEHLAMGIAAAVAMTWTVGLQLACMLWLGLDINRGVRPEILISFVVVTVLGYVLKDRLKVLVGRMLAARIPRLLYDRRTDFTRFGRDEPTASVRETMRFVRRDELPPEVQATREAIARSPLALRTDAHILWYRRQVTIFPRSTARSYPRMAGLVDILRVNVWRWVRGFDRANKPVLLLASGAPRQVEVPNHYVADLVVRLGREGGDARLSAARIVLDRRGVVEVREPDQPREGKIPSSAMM